MFDFRQLKRENKKIIPVIKSKIYIDGEIFNPTEKYNIAKNIVFESEDGRVEVSGKFDLKQSETKISEFIDLTKSSVDFDDQFVKIVERTYSGVKVDIIFNKITQDMEITNAKAVKDYITKDLNTHEEYKNGRLHFKFNKLQNVDFRKYHLTSQNLDENIQGGFQIGANLTSLKKKKFRDESGMNKSYEQEREFILSNREEIESQIEVEPIFTQNLNFINFQNDFKDFQFTNESMKNEHKLKFNDSYHLKENEKLRKFKKSYFSNSFKPCFNNKGEFVTLGKFNNNTSRHEIKINKIVPNKKLELEKSNEGIEFYHKNTINYYLSILSQKIKEKSEVNLIDNHNLTVPNKLNFSESPIGKINQNFTTTNKKIYRNENSLSSVDLITVNDYTFIINDYINNLIRQKEDLKVKTNQNNFNPIDNKLKNVTLNLIEKLDKEISTLKLFRILFLNPFIDNENNSNINFNSRKENNQACVESLREETKKMRKKKLIDWLIENTEKDFKSEFEEISKKSNNNKNDYSLIFHCLISGRIRKAIDICNQKGLFSLGMMIAQTNSNPKSNMIKESLKDFEKLNLLEFFPDGLKKIYYVISNNDNDKNIKEILRECDWRKIFIFSSLFSLTPHNDISKVMNNYEMIKKIDFNNKNILPLSNFSNFSNQNSKLENINFLLIQLYSNLEMNENVNDVLNKLSNTQNIFPQEFTDHHIHYMIITILLNTLKETYNFNYGEIDSKKLKNLQNFSNVINFTQIHLKSLHIKLLLKTHEEILISQQDEVNWKFSINLITHSNIHQKNQNLIIENILYENVISACLDKTFNDPYSYNTKVTKNALGLLKYSQFDYDNAFTNFNLAQNFPLAFEIFIFYILSNKIIENNINNEIKEKMNFLMSKSNNDYLWEKYGNVFCEYLTLITKFDDRKLNGQRDLDILINLIRKVEVMNVTIDVTREKLINFLRGILLKNLRRIFNSFIDVIYLF